MHKLHHFHLNAQPGNSQFHWEDKQNSQSNANLDYQVMVISGCLFLLFIENNLEKTYRIVDQLLYKMKNKQCTSLVGSLSISDDHQTSNEER